MKIFLDTSSLLKLYLQESGSERVMELLIESTSVAVSALTEAEAISAMNRVRREGKLSEVEYRHLRNELTRDISTFDLVEVNKSIIAQAIELLEASPLRASDAVQVASAHKVSAELFVTADRLQFAAARASGLKVLDPSANSR